MGFFSALNFISERINGLAHDAIVNRKYNISLLFLILEGKAVMVARCSFDVAVESALVLVLNT